MTTTHKHPADEDRAKTLPKAAPDAPFHRASYAGPQDELADVARQASAKAPASMTWQEGATKAVSDLEALAKTDKRAFWAGRATIHDYVATLTALLQRLQALNS